MSAIVRSPCAAVNVATQRTLYKQTAQGASVTDYPIYSKYALALVPGGARSGLHPEKQTVSCTSKGKIYPHDSAMSLQGKTPGRELLYILQIFCYYRRKALYHESLVRSPFRSR